MSTGDSDKTIFRPPNPGGDSTVIMPTPGGGRRNMPQPAEPPAAAGRMPAPGGQAHATGFQAQPVFHTSHGLNPLVNAASALITVFERIRYTPSHSDVDGLYQRLVNEIKTFEGQLRSQQVKPEIVLAARYSLCTVIDEAVLNTPWGAESNWPQRTLLSTFHNETGGGEKFFLLVDKLRASPMENLNILELFYLCLSLGYEGKYKYLPQGRDALEQVRDDLFSIIRNYRGEYERSLSPNWQGLGQVQNSLENYLPMWVVVTAAVAILLISYTGFQYGLHHTSAPVVKQLLDVERLHDKDHMDNG